MKLLPLTKTTLLLSKKRTRDPRLSLNLFVTAARAMTTKKVHAHRLALATKETGALLEQRQDQASDTTRRVAWTCSIKPQLSFRHAFKGRPRHATCVARLRRATRFSSCSTNVSTWTCQKRSLIVLLKEFNASSFPCAAAFLLSQGTLLLIHAHVQIQESIRARVKHDVLNHLMGLFHLILWNDSMKYDGTKGNLNRCHRFKCLLQREQLVERVDA